MKRVLISAAVLSLAVAGASQASAAPSVYKVTGGGQITSTTTPTGAGDTIAFTAQSADATGDNAKGQLQYNQRSGTPTKFHGVISCVVVAAAEDGMPAMARLEGTMRGEADTAATHFVVDVVDDGQGNGTMDMISLRKGFVPDEDDDGDTSCDTDDEFDGSASLGRGNVKIHKVRG